MKHLNTACSILAVAACALLLTQCRKENKVAGEVEQPVDYVDPYIGNISHLLVPTFPTTQLPNSMLRVFPDRRDFTDEYVHGLPIAVTNHREQSAFKLLPLADGKVNIPMSYNYDNEHITPYSFDVELADNSIKAEYALSHQSAIYRISFEDATKPSIALHTDNGSLDYDTNCIFGSQELPNNTKIYVYLESQTAPESVSGAPEISSKSTIMMSFPKEQNTVLLRYGISLISCEQAKANLYREIEDYDLEALAAQGRSIWNKALSRIEVKSDSKEDKIKFYSFYYRTFERPLCITEGDKYFSAYDHKVHESEEPFYVDDWIWDTYRAAHPLRSITDATTEELILSSFLRMARQSGENWMPTFPEINGDSRRMNGNHGVGVVAEALSLGLKADYMSLYEICSKGIDEKTLAPWSSTKAGWIDDFYKQNGYIPALRPGEKETDPNVHFFEKRQPVAVTLGTAYDQWCLYTIAHKLDLADELPMRAQHALDYRNIYNEDTKFFHPKDKDGNFIPNVNYSFCGGLGAREYYGENNGWVYRWDVPHNVGDLVSLMGGSEAFAGELDKTFGTPLGKSKFNFYAMLPDHTGNVGQFSMANEPSLHVPYLYNYAGKPWKTQKRIRQMLDTWFRNDLMGVPGDEDGGGMSAFVTFSMLGFYPVTPGTATYNIGSPMFDQASVHLSNGNTFTIVAENVSEQNKYIQSATLDGKQWNKPWFSYEDIKDGAQLTLVMGPKPNKSWGANLDNVPPSAEF